MMLEEILKIVPETHRLEAGQVWASAYDEYVYKVPRKALEHDYTAKAKRYAYNSLHNYLLFTKLI